MKISAPEAIGAIIIGFVVWLFLRASGKEVAPQTEEQDIGGMITNAWAGEGGEHYMDPNTFIGTPVLLPTRYPIYTGTNISTLVVRGTAPLFRKLPHDYSYIVNPPGNEGIGNG